MGFTVGARSPIARSGMNNKHRKEVAVDRPTITWTREGAQLRPSSLDEFAIVLKTWRVARGWSQRQMERETGISRYTIMRAEAASAHLNWESLYRLFIVMQREP